MNYFLCLAAALSSPVLDPNKPIVTIEKYIEHRQSLGQVVDFKAPETVLILYQKKAVEALLKNHPEYQASKDLSHLYLAEGGKVGILAYWGIGAPALALRMEELSGHGTKRFIAVGTAGSLMDQHKVGDYLICHKALAEDGVAHHYLPQGEKVSYADQKIIGEWTEFSKKKGLGEFGTANAWSFSAMFRETMGDVLRVHEQGFNVVEMEAATVLAIAQEKGIEALSLLVISDVISKDEWKPKNKDPSVELKLNHLVEAALGYAESPL